MFRYVRAMSFDKQRIEDRLASLAEPVTDHLIKLYLFSNSEYRDHWRKEIWSFLNKVPKLRMNNKFPSSNFIFKLISGYADMASQLMFATIDEYSELTPERFDSEELESILIEYFKWISSKLSQEGVVRSSEVYAKLDELTL